LGWHFPHVALPTQSRGLALAMPHIARMTITTQRTGAV